MGIPPREYINAERMRQATSMLRDGESVLDTAMTLGFSSSNYFAVVFRRHMGCSPREYTKRYRAQSYFVADGEAAVTGGQKANGARKKAKV